MSTSRSRLTLVVALLALVAALASPAVAARLITGAQIKDSTITGVDVRNGSLSRNDLAPTAQAPTLVRARVKATAGADQNAARASAPRRVLLKKGPVSFYVKCFTDNATNTTFGEVYAASSAPGTILNSEEDSLDGSTGGYLAPGVAETDAVINSAAAAANDATTSAADDGEFMTIAASGASSRGQSGIAVKNGAPPAGNGAYGAGNVCLFNLYAFVG